MSSWEVSRLCGGGIAYEHFRSWILEIGFALHSGMHRVEHLHKIFRSLVE